MRLSGTVASGLGRAHVFMAQTHYQEQFKSVLGAGAWPGTLNVDVDEKDIDKYRGKYRMGWDQLRENRYRRQIELGLFEEKLCTPALAAKLIP